MSAQTLRDAAARLRTLAEAATPVEWKVLPHKTVRSRQGVYVAHYLSKADAAYIAAMSPPVALALADLLDAVDRAARLAGSAADHPEARSLRAEALAVARAVLGEA